MKGRKPKDVAMKILTGNPGKRAVSPSSDAPFTKSPLEKPAGLDDFASAEWDRITDTLAPILSPASSGMVLVACDSFSQWQRAQQVVNEKGFTYTTTNKHGLEMSRQRPEVGIAERARTAYHRALTELGASPVAHTRVKPLPDDKQGELYGLGRLLG